VGGSGALTGGKRLAEVPCGGVSVTGSSAVWATGLRGRSATGFEACADFLLPLALAALTGFPDFAGLLALAALAACFLAAQASDPTREKAAIDAKKLRRFKNFLRQRQPVAETKRPCH
jgi:hypothetical protein